MCMTLANNNAASSALSSTTGDASFVEVERFKCSAREAPRPFFLELRELLLLWVKIRNSTYSWSDNLFPVKSTIYRITGDHSLVGPTVHSKTDIFRCFYQQYLVLLRMVPVIGIPIIYWRAVTPVFIVQHVFMFFLRAVQPYIISKIRDHQRRQNVGVFLYQVLNLLIICLLWPHGRVRPCS